MRRSLFLLIVLLLNTIAYAGVPVYVSSTPNGLTTPPSSYPSPLNFIVESDSVLVTFNEAIKANTSGTARTLQLKIGTTASIIIYSKSGSFWGNSSCTIGTTQVRVDPNNSSQLIVKMTGLQITNGVETSLVIGAGFIMSQSTSSNVATTTLKYIGDAPLVIDRYPVHNQTDVLSTDLVQITFKSSVALALDPGLTFSILNSDNSVFWTTTSEDLNFNFLIDNRYVTLIDIPPFTNGNSYKIVYDEGFFTDGGSYLVPEALNGDWNFSVNVLNHLSLSPSDNALDVEANAPLAINFGESVVVGSGSVTIYRSDFSVYEVIPALSAYVDATGMSIIIPHLAFEPGGDYFVFVDPGFVTAVSGGSYSGLLNETDWNFSIALGNLWIGDYNSDFTNVNNWVNQSYNTSLPFVITGGGTFSPNINTTVNGVDLIVTPTGSLTIGSSGILNLSGDLSIESNSSNNGSLIINGTLNVSSSNVYIHQFASNSSAALLRKKGYSSPISSVTGNDLGLVNPILKYENVDKAYKDVPLSEVWEVGKGYASYITAPIVFNGAINSADEYPILFTFTAVPTPPAVNSSAYNFFGNPYTAPLNWTTMYADSGEVAPFRETCWILRESTSWVEVSGKTGIVTNGPGTNGLIPRGHAFALRAKPGVDTVLYLKKSYLEGNNQTYLKSLNTLPTPEYIRFVGYNPIDTTAQTDLVFGKHVDAFDGFDSFDAEKYSYPNTSDSKSLQIATYAPTGEILAQSIASASPESVFNIAYYAKVAGGYCIKISEATELLKSEDVTIVLTDVVENISVSIKDSGYCFYSNATPNPVLNRFVVTIVDNSLPTLIEPVDELINVAVVYSSSNIRITLTDDLLQRIEVYNINGTKVLSREASGASAVVNFEGNGVYVVKVIGIKGTSSHKIVASAVR